MKADPAVREAPSPRTRLSSSDTPDRTVRLAVALAVLITLAALGWGAYAATVGDNPLHFFAATRLPLLAWIVVFIFWQWRRTRAMGPARDDPDAHREGGE